MAVSTPKNIPYPLGTDRVMDGDDAMRRIAQSVDNMVQGRAESIPVTTADTNGTLAVTFPVPYASPPVVVTGLNQGPPAGTNQNAFVWAASITATGFNFVGRRSASGTTLSASWVAVGPVTPVS